RNHCRHVPKQPLVHYSVTTTGRDQSGGKRVVQGVSRARIRKTQGFPVLPANRRFLWQIPRVCEMTTPLSAGFSRPVSLGVVQATLQTLVTGVSGYVGAALVPRLVRDGHSVRGFARSRERVLAAGAQLDDLVLGDATTGVGLDRALDGIDVAYY